MKRIIITGATGLLGLALIKQWLKTDCKIYAITRKDSKRISVLPNSEKLKIIECDLSEIKSLDKQITETCDVFYHLGWAHTGAGKYGDIKFQTENIDYSIDAARVAARIGCGLFVGAGSQAEYGLHNLRILSPDSYANPITPYGISKYAAGKLVGIECSKLGVICVWVRIFSTYGFNDKEDLFMGSLVKKMIRNEHISMTEGIQQWDYLFCDDAGNALFRIGNKCTQNAIYCLGSGKTRQLKEYVEIVADKTGYKQKIGFGEIPYSNDNVLNLCADISKLSEDTGFMPMTKFEDGINLYIQFLLNENNAPIR